MSGRWRDNLGPALYLGLPCLAAAIAAAGFMMPHPVGTLLTSYPYERLFLAANATLATVGAGAGGWLEPGTLTRRIESMVGCAGIGLTVFVVAFAVFASPLALVS